MREYFNRRLITILFLGFSSGLPLALISSTLQAWYTVSGVSLVVIGWLTLAQQPYSYKFLWAPFLDRWMPIKLGRRRSWIFLMQCAMGITFTAMAFCHPEKTPLLLAILALVVAFFSSTQDTAFDAYRTELLPEHERGIGTSIYLIAYRIAMMISGALALILAAKIGWRATYLIMAGCFFGLMIITKLAPNADETNLQPSTLRAAIVEPFKSFFTKKNAVLILIFIIIYKLCDAMALSLNTAFLIRGVGFSLVQVGEISKTMGILALFLGSMVGGLLMRYISVYRSLIIFGFLQMTSNLLYTWLAVVGKSVLVMAVAIFGEYFFSALGTVAFLVFLMNLCDRRYTATQYALFAAVSALGRIFIGPVAAECVKYVGWADFYVITALVGLPSLFILWYLKRGELFSVAQTSELSV